MMYNDYFIVVNTPKGDVAVSFIASKDYDPFVIPGRVVVPSMKDGELAWVYELGHNVPKVSHCQSKTKTHPLLDKGHHVADVVIEKLYG